MDKNYVLPSEVAGVDRLTGMPTIYISKSILEELNENTLVYMLKINVDKEQEAVIKADLNELVSSRGLWIETRSDMVESFKSTKMILKRIW